MSQMAFGFDALQRARGLLAEMLRDLDASCEQQRKKTVAAELDLAPSTLSNVLAGRKGCSAELLLGLMELDESNVALKRLAARRGYQLRRMVTTEQKYARVMEVLRRRVGDIAEEIEREALGEER